MSKILRIFTIVLLPVFTLGLGWQLGAQYTQQEFENVSNEWNEIFSGGIDDQIESDPEEEVNISMLWTVWRLLLKNYIDPQDLEVTPMLHGAVSGLTNAVGDPYTTFMTPKVHTEFKQSMQGRLQGIGAELTMRDGFVVVVAPLKGSPAEAAGVLPEDKIVAVDGEDITEQALIDVVQKIRGTKGTDVTISVMRKGEEEPIDIAITRDDIRVPMVEAEIKETATGSIGVIAINQFGDGAITDVRKALQSYLSKDLDGLVLDLRFNGGGYLDGAVQLTSLFLDNGKVVSVRRRHGADEEHYVTGTPLVPELPLVVMINEGSASASEITAGALQDAGRATIVGKKSFGKGTVQEVIELPGGASLRVTIAKWLTPDGRDLGKEGVQPDIIVERTREQIQDGEDPQLDAALEWLLDGEGKEVQSKEVQSAE